MPGRDAYNLDGVANIEADRKPSSLGSGIYPVNKGDEQMDGVISVDTSAKMTYGVEDAFPTGAAVPLDATTDLPMGSGATRRYMGDTGDCTDWPKAYEE